MALLACAEDEQHSLPVYALATGCWVESRVLGARTLRSALAGAVRTPAPAAVFVWSQQAVTGDPAALSALPGSCPPYRLVLGGPGWWGEPPRGAVRVASLEEAMARVAAATA